MTISIGSSDPVWVDPLVNFLAVLLGAALSLGTTYLFERRQRRERDLATAYSLIFKLSEILERLVRLDQHVTQCLANAKATNFDGPPWGAILEAIGFNALPQPISADEFALIARTKDDSLAMKIKELENGHAICFQSYDKIIQLKQVLGGTGLIVSTDGQAVSFEATPQQYANLAPVIAGLDGAVAGLLKVLPEVVAEAQKIAPAIGPKLKEHYRFDHFVTLEIPQ